MDKFDEVVLREKERKLSISRIPKQTKEEFVKFSNEEFCEDFGMCFKYVWDHFKLWKIFFENQDFKLNHIIELLTQEKKPEKETISMMSGRKVEKGVE